MKKRILLLLCMLTATLLHGQVKVSELPNASSLDGNEIVPMVQSSATVIATLASIETYFQTGRVVGTDIQAYNVGLQSISGLTTVTDQMLYTTAADAYAVTPLTAAARSLLDDPDVDSMRSSLGLGSVSVLDLDADGINDGGVAVPDENDVFDYVASWWALNLASSQSVTGAWTFDLAPNINEDQSNPSAIANSEVVTKAGMLSVMAQVSGYVGELLTNRANWEFVKETCFYSITSSSHPTRADEGIDNLMVATPSNFFFRCFKYFNTAGQ